MLRLPHNSIVGAVCWLLCAVLLVHLIIAKTAWSWFVRVPTLVLLACILAAVFYGLVYSAWRAEKAAETSGVLIAVGDGRDHSGERPEVQLGQGASTFVLDLLQNQAMNLFGLPQDTVRVKKAGGEVLLSTTVRDGAGNLVVEIVDNHWTVSPSKTNCWDKNYTQDSLEVKDGRGRVVLQVRLLPNRIQIQGEWPNLNAPGKPNVIYEDGQFSERDGITPRFKYPSELYWGERVN